MDQILYGSLMVVCIKIKITFNALLLKKTLMFALGLVLYKLETNEKCQVSSVDSARFG